VLLLSCDAAAAFPVLLLSCDDVREVDELSWWWWRANAWLFAGIAVSTPSIRIPASAKGKIIIAIGLCTISCKK
jgi:hypothetical protein